jgi:BirA family biotin operon repressor/biotin-[acetyl-CoA-carboxylase] ligase
VTELRDLPGVPGRLEPDGVRRHMDTRWLGDEIHCLERVGSTNTVAADLAARGAAHGTVVIAEAQESGRGRLGRSWVSPGYKNLYISIVLRTDLPADRVPQITLLAGVAACDAVADWHEAVIKWPNDVLIDGRKVGGILAETRVEAAERVVVLGIGLNLNATNEDFPAELRGKATSLFIATGRPVDRAHVAGRLLTEIERRFDDLSVAGFAPIAQAWRERSLMIGRSVRVEEAGDLIAGEALGLDADGALRIRLDSGAERRIVAGDVTVLGGYGQSMHTQFHETSLSPRHCGEKEKPAT